MVLKNVFGNVILLLTFITKIASASLCKLWWHGYHKQSMHLVSIWKVVIFTFFFCSRIQL